MNRHFVRVVAAAVMAFSFSSQAVRAQDYNSSYNSFWSFITGNQDPRLFVSGTVIGLGASAGYYALRQKHGPSAINPQFTRMATPLAAFGLTTIGCAAAFPIVGTLWLNRPLTTREVYTGIAGCVVPVIGPWVMDAAFHGQAWYEPPAVPPRRHH
jgi:hypothetical protein